MAASSTMHSATGGGSTGQILQKLGERRALHVLHHQQRLEAEVEELVHRHRVLVGEALADSRLPSRAFAARADRSPDAGGVA
jgi:hypothetical protein